MEDNFHTWNIALYPLSELHLGQYVSVVEFIRERDVTNIPKNMLNTWYE
jgi:hypothetical protein